jgi:hypothetical protein
MLALLAERDLLLINNLQQAKMPSSPHHLQMRLQVKPLNETRAEIEFSALISMIYY